MKATIDFDESLYRRLKMEAARRGRTVRDLVAEGVRHVLGLSPLRQGGARADTSDAGKWVGSLRRYAGNAGGAHDLASIRRSIAKGREQKARRK